MRIPEAGRSMLEQDEASRRGGGGPNQYLCANRLDDLSIGVKGQSRPEIAGSP